MAISDLETLYPGQVEPSSTEYPQGAPRDESTPGANDGTPLQEDWVRDLWGAFSAVIKAGGVTPSGDVENADTSDFLDAMNNLINGLAVSGYENNSFFYRKTPVFPVSSVNVLSDTSYAGSPGTATVEVNTVGPTGSGADVIWTDLDNLPSDAKALELFVSLSYKTNQVAALDDFETATYFGDGDISDANLIQSGLLLSQAFDDNDGSMDVFKNVQIKMTVPLNAANVFKSALRVFRLTSPWLAGYSVTATLIGWYR